MAYSMDLRIRAVQAYEAGGIGQTDLAELFQVSPITLHRWIVRSRKTGLPKRLPRGGGRIRRIGAIGETVLLGIIERTPDATLAELAIEYAWVTHMPMNASVISHTLKRLDITQKKRPFSPANVRANGFRPYVRSLPNQLQRYPQKILYSLMNPVFL